VKDQLLNGGIKGAFIWGEDPVGSGTLKADELGKLDLLVVSTPFMTATAEIADVILPGSTPLETSGTYLSGDRKIKHLRRAQAPAANLDNLTVINDLAQVMKTRLPQLAVPESAEVWGPYIKYADGFGLADGKASLILPADQLLFDPAPIQDPAIRKFNLRLTELGIK
jgi:formate dehydrogenase major subunit